MNQQVYKMIDSKIERDKQLSICDYGCGSGELLNRLIKNFSNNRYCGVDRFSQFRSFDSSNYNSKIELIDRDCEQFQNVEIEKFDFIFATFSLHHFQYPMKEIATILNLLKDGGRLYFIDLEFAHDSSSSYVKNFSSGIEDLSKALRGLYHRRHYTLEEAVDLFYPFNVEIKVSRSLDLDYDEDEYNEDLQFSKTIVDRKIATPK